jgi:hypothetical protein
MTITELAHDEAGGWWSTLPLSANNAPTDLCYDCGVSRDRHSIIPCGAGWVKIGLPANYRYDVIPDGNWGEYQNIPALDCRDRDKMTGQLNERWWDIPTTYKK